MKMKKRWALTRVVSVAARPSPASKRKLSAISALHSQTFYVCLGRLLKTLRQQCGFAQEEVGKYLELHQAAISRLEAGTQVVSALQLYALACMYGSSVDELVQQASEAALKSDSIAIAA